MREESEREVLERLEATRERMGRTIEQIGDRMNPDRVQHELKSRARGQVDELKQSVKRKARNTMDDVQHEMQETGRGIWGTIRDNPVPAGMVGVGLAWLMANGNGHSRSYRSAARYELEGRYAAGDRYGSDGYAEGSRYNRYRPVPSPSYGSGDTYHAGPEMAEDGSGDSGMMDRGREKLSGAAETAREKTSDAADTARHKGEEAIHAAREKGERVMESARERGHDMSHEARERARHMADEARYRARRVEHRVEDTLRENPVTAGVVAAALGFAAGMMLPESEREREMMGPARDRLKDRAKETAHRAADKAKDVARETASESAKRAVDEVWSKGSEGEEMTEPGR